MGRMTDAEYDEKRFQEQLERAERLRDEGARLGPDELLVLHRAACRKLHHEGEIWKFWAHVTSGDRYVVMDVALREEDLMPVVVYARGPINWTRPLETFLGRFERVRRVDRWARF